MRIAPPRRPRRWSPACSGTLVRLLVGVVLVALVAWPERHVPAVWRVAPSLVAPANSIAGMGTTDTNMRRQVRELEEQPAQARAENHVIAAEFYEWHMLEGDARSTVNYPTQRLFVAAFAADAVHERWLAKSIQHNPIRAPNAPPRPIWMYHDASFHVLLDVIRAVIDR